MSFASCPCPMPELTPVPSQVDAPPVAATADRRNGGVRTLWRLTYPIIVGNLAAVTLTVADGAVLGHFSTLAVAAVGLASPVAVVATVLATGWATSVQVLVARHRGAGEERAIESAVDVATVFGILVGGVVAIIVAATASPLMHASTGDNAVATTASNYLRIVAIGLPLSGAMTALRSALNGMGLTKVTMRAAIGVNLLNVPIDVGLVYGLGWGAVGAALGTVLALALTLVVLARYTFRRLPGCPRPLRLGAWRAELPRMWRVGWPETAMLACGYVTSVVLGAVVAGLGLTALAAWSVLGRVLPVLWTVVYACSTGIAILVGQRLGAGDMEEAQASLRSGWLVTGSLAAAIVLPVVVLPDLVFGALSGDGAVVDAAVAARLFLFGQAPLMVATMVFTGALRAAGDTRSIMVAATVASYLCSLPASWFLATRLDLGLQGIFLGQFGYWVVRLTLTYRRYAAKAWMTVSP